LGWQDLRMIFFLIGGRRGIPDLMGAKPFPRVLNAARGDVGRSRDVCLWSLF